MLRLKSLTLLLNMSNQPCAPGHDHIEEFAFFMEHKKLERETITEEAIRSEIVKQEI